MIMRKNMPYLKVNKHISWISIVSDVRIATIFQQLN